MKIKNETTITLPNHIHKTLMAAMFKHMFPPMNVAATQLVRCRRVVFINYDNEKHRIDIRHYKIFLKFVDIPRPIGKLIAKYPAIKDKMKNKNRQNKKDENSKLKPFR